MENDYRQILKNVYESRKLKNPSYSLKAFSKSAGFKSYHLSDIISGRHSLSRKSSQLIARNLRLSDELAEEFLLLVALEKPQDEAEKSIILKKLHDLRTSKNVLLLDDQFNAISEWYFLAIIEFFRNESNSQLQLCDVSKCLEIPEDLLASAIETLLRFGYLQKKGQGYSPCNDHLSIRKKQINSSVIRKYHGQILAKGLKSLESTPVEKRYFHTFNVLLTAENYNLICERVSRFIRDEIESIKQSKHEGKVHAVCFQVFPVEKPD